MQSPWNGQTPANVSPVLRATRMWPSSVWFMPKIGRPRTMVPTPMPVPTVTYAIVVEALRRAPAPFGERRAVHVGVESHGHAEAAAESLRDVGVAPAGLGRRGDESVGGRARAQIDRTERGDAERARGAVLLAPALEHRLDLPQRLFALAGGQALDGAHVIGTGAEDAHALGAAQLDTRQ